MSIERNRRRAVLAYPDSGISNSYVKTLPDGERVVAIYGLVVARLAWSMRHNGQLIEGLEFKDDKGRFVLPCVYEE